MREEGKGIVVVGTGWAPLMMTVREGSETKVKVATAAVVVVIRDTEGLGLAMKPLGPAETCETTMAILFWFDLGLERVGCGRKRLSS